MTPSAISGRTAVITGGGSGIGRAIARHAAARGMKVAIADRDATGLAATAEAIPGALACELDVTRSEGLSEFAAAVQAQLPPVAMVFANAGVLAQGSMTDFPPADLARVLAINVVGAVATVQAFLPLLRAAGGYRQIIVTGSTGSMAGYPHIAAYCASKHALWPIAEGLRADLAGEGIGVSMLMPGPVDTQIYAALDPDRPRTPGAIPPEAAARIAFAGALENRQLILTHPDFVDRARERFDAAVAELARPL